MFNKKRKYKKKNEVVPIELDENGEEIHSGIKKGILIVLIVTLGFVSLLSLFGAAGALGIYIQKFLTMMLGWGRWSFPSIMLFLGYFFYSESKYHIKGITYVGIFLFFISVHALMHLFVPVKDWSTAINLGIGGGYTGYLVALAFYKTVDLLASWIILLAIFISSLMLIFNAPLQRIIGRESPLAILFAPFKFLHNKLFAKIDTEGNEDEDSQETEDASDDDEKEEEIAKKYDNESLDEIFSVKTISEDGKPKRKATLIEEQLKKVPDVDLSLNSSIQKIDLPINLLKAAASKPTSGDIKANVEIITNTLENFGIPIEMGDITVGPTVTQYAFKPADGVKLSRITTLRSDLSLALAAHPIRIEAPIPGKALVGIEIPNQKKALVSLREILTDPSFKKTEGNLVIGLGKDVAGKVWVDNLAKMPHVIVAGATNSGKSVCLNTIIVSLLYRNNPDELRFIMVDPKRVELTVYNDIPHLLCPVITDVAKTINALKWCLNEMDKRFEYLSKKGKRNIQSYNEGLKGHDQKMPYIIFVIDELADLMVSAKKDVEAAIIRLAQMARAVGIHLILATQRPSTDVITGLIKANTPARIAFAVASGIDSRTILDSIGAEDLLGQGDMLITTPSISQPKRLQGAYLSDIEIKRIVRYIKEQVNGETFYLDAIMQAQKVRGVGNMGIGRNSSDDGGEDSDSLFLESKELVVNAGKASASLLQRRLSVGYARAARIMDLLEEAGIIGPANGAKPRDILISKEELNVETSFTPLHNPKDFARPQKYLDNKADDHFNEEEPGLPPVFKKEKKDKYVTPENNPEKSLASFDYDEYEKEDDNNNDFSSNQEDKILDDDKELIQPKNKVNLEDNGKYFSK